MSKSDRKGDIVLVDTDVFSYLGKPNGKNASLYLPHVDQKRMALSFITVGELHFGAKKNGWSAARVAGLNDQLRSVLIVPYDLEVCKVYADIKARLTVEGQCIADNDLWIASCAIRHSIPLISNNRKHFERVPGLHLISEAKTMIEVKAQMNLMDHPELSQPSTSGPSLPSTQSSSSSEEKAPPL